MKVGCFQIDQIGPGRWCFLNTLTGITHVSYGTVEEMVEQAKIQTKGWKERLAQKKGIMGTGTGRSNGSFSSRKGS